MHSHTAGDILARIEGSDFMFVSERCSSGVFFSFNFVGRKEGNVICPWCMTGGGRIGRQSYGTAQPAHLVGFGVS